MSAPPPQPPDQGPDDEAPAPRLMPPAFWIALAFGLLFVIAGAVVGLLGPLRRAGAYPAAGRRAALTAPMVHGKGAGFPHPPTLQEPTLQEVLVGQS